MFVFSNTKYNTKDLLNAFLHKELNKMYYAKSAATLYVKE